MYSVIMAIFRKLGGYVMLSQFSGLIKYNDYLFYTDVNFHAIGQEGE